MSENTAEGFNGLGEGERAMQYVISEIAELGYGDPNAHISPDRKLRSGELSLEAVEAAAEIIKSGECMAPITKEDDGCIDGRQALSLLYPDSGRLVKVDVDNPFKHKRAKVSGGGYITALAMKLALDPHVIDINGDLIGVAEHLTRLGIYCGVHTGGHGDETSCGCGANDNFDAILANLNNYSLQLNQTVRAWWSYCDTSEEYNEVIEKKSNDGVATTLSHKGYFAGSTGVARFKVIMEQIVKTQKQLGDTGRPLSVSKHLGGEHNEAFVIVNTVKDRTFSQAAFKEKLQQVFPDLAEEKLPQVFVIDVWRIVQLAHAMAEGRASQDLTENEAFQIALHAGLGFQLATLATLTDGSLRNFVVR